MRTVEIPKLSYSVWHLWEERNTILGARDPGVYLIAISDKSLAGENPEYTDVCYIGMTNSQERLKGRWAQFAQEIQRTRPRREKPSVHSGGSSVFRKLGHYDKWSQQLFVSAMPIICDTKRRDSEDLLKMGQVAFLEYEAFSEYYKAMPHQRKPPYNKK